MLKSIHTYIALLLGGLVLYQGAIGAAYAFPRRAASSAYMASMRRLGKDAPRMNTTKMSHPGFTMPNTKPMFSQPSPSFKPSFRSMSGKPFRSASALKKGPSLFEKLAKDAFNKDIFPKKGAAPMKSTPALLSPKTNAGATGAGSFGVKIAADTLKKESKPLDPLKDSTTENRPESTKDFVLDNDLGSAVKDFIKQNQQKRRDPRDKFERFKEKNAPSDNQTSSPADNSSGGEPLSGDTDADDADEAGATSCTEKMHQQKGPFEDLGQTFMADEGNMAGRMRQPEEPAAFSYESDAEHHPAPAQQTEVPDTRVAPVEDSGSSALDGDPVSVQNPVVDATQYMQAPDEDDLFSEDGDLADADEFAPKGLPHKNGQAVEKNFPQERQEQSSSRGKATASPAQTTSPASRGGDISDGRNDSAYAASPSYDNDYEPYRAPLHGSGKVSASARHPLSSRSSYEGSMLASQKASETLCYPWSLNNRPVKAIEEIHAQPVAMPSISELAFEAPAETSGESSPVSTTGSSITHRPSADGLTLGSVMKGILYAASYVSLLSLSCAQATRGVIRTAVGVLVRFRL